MAETSLGGGSSRRCLSCLGTDHLRASNKQCPHHKPKAKNIAHSNLKCPHLGDQSTVYKYFSVQLTVITNLHNILLDPSLQSIIEHAVSTTTTIAKYLSEIMNIIL